jgi:hypothetical protein
MNNKNSILFLFIAYTGIIPIQANEIHDAIQREYDEIDKQHEPMLQQEYILIKELDYTLYERFFFLDEKREVLRKSPETKQFLHDFFILNTQLLGIQFCKDCLDKIKNPNALDVRMCHEKGLESDDNRRKSLRIASAIDDGLRYDRLCRRGFYKGNHLLQKRINAIVKKENFN